MAAPLLDGALLEPFLRALSNGDAGAVVCIDGKIGAGKSSLGAALRRVAEAVGMDVHFERERRHAALLELYIGAPRDYGALFQMIMLEDARNRLHTSEVVACRGALALLERGVLGNSVFAGVNARDGMISENDYKFYRRALPLRPAGDTRLLVYLHVSHGVALHRMGVRGVESEKKYDNAYLLRLDDAYFRAICGELAAGAAVAPVPWDCACAPLDAPASAPADALTLSLSATRVPLVARDLVALARYAAAVASGAKISFTLLEAGARATFVEGARASMHASMAFWCAPEGAHTPPLAAKTPLHARWASDGAPAEAHKTTFYVWADYVCGAAEWRERFQYALFCSVCNLESVVLVVDSASGSVL
jgi:deoxyadenosine/deoxycytidine kinase